MSHTCITLTLREPEGWARLVRVAPGRARLYQLLLAALFVRLPLIGWRELGSLEAGYLAGGTIPSPHGLFQALVDIGVLLGFAHSPWLARLLPLTAQLAAVALVYALAARMNTPRAGLAAAALAAFWPPWFEAAPLIRPETFIAPAVLFGAYAMWRAEDSRLPEWWVFYWLGLSILLHLTPLAVLWAVPLLFALPIAGGRLHTLGTGLLAASLAFAVYVPALRVLLEGEPWRDFSPAPVSLREFAASHLRVLLMDSAQPAAGHAPAVQAFALGLFAALAAAGAAILWAREGWRPATVLLMLFGLPLAGAWLAVRDGVPVAAEALQVQGLFAALPAGIALGALPGRRWPAVAAAALLATAWLPQAWQAGMEPAAALERLRGEPEGYRAAAQHVQERWRSGDLLLHAGPETIAPFLVQNPGIDATALGAAAHGARRAQTSAAAVHAPSFTWPHPPELVEALAPGYERIWLAAPMRMEHGPYHAGDMLRRWLDARWFETDRVDFPSFHLLLYEKRVEGRWTRLVSRDEDEFHSQLVEYDNGGAVFCRKQSLNPGPGYDVSGPAPAHLRLAFSEPHIDATLVDLSREETPEFAAFELTNLGAETVTVTVRVAATEWLVDLAGLVNHPPDSHVWHTTWMREGLDAEGGWRLPSLTARVSRDAAERGAAAGGFALGPGEYQVYLFEQTLPEEAASLRAEVELWMNDAPVYESQRTGAPLPGGWHWLPGAAGFSLPRYDGWVPVLARASLPREAAEAQAHLAYAAIVRARPGVSAEDRMRTAFSQSYAVIAPGQTLPWAALVDQDTRRVDVWVFEEGPNGRAYRIFKRLGPAPEAPI